jgi:hypothetical protein
MWRGTGHLLPHAPERSPPVPTVDTLIIAATERRKAAERKLADADRGMRSLVHIAEAAGRSNMTPEEDQRVVELTRAKSEAKTEISRIEGELEGLRQVAGEEIDYARQAGQITPTNVRRPAYDQVLRVGREERTYRPDQDPNGKSFLLDVARGFLHGDPSANQRLNRHMDEERVERADKLQRAVGTSAFVGLTVPQYLTDLYAPATAALRPFADAACAKHPLPEQGMTIELSRITTATSAALQATQNTAVSETNEDDTALSIAVQTAAGQQTVSRQAIDRGTGIEDVTMQDLFKRVNTVLDSTLINQATTGLAAVAQAVTYTDASPTGAELYPKILGAAAGVEAALLAMGRPSHAVMHSRRWYWLSSQMSSTWPLVNWANLPVQAGATADPNSMYASGIRGVLPCGLLVVVDNNIGTTLGAGTEDELYVTAQDECHLWEDPNAPMFIRAEQPQAGTLGVVLVAFSYFAYTFGRYANAAGKVAGTGMIAPVFV